MSQPAENAGDDRFARLFADLEAEAGARADLDEEAVLGDLERGARAQVTLADRLRAAPGELTLVVRGVGAVRGRVQEVGSDVVVVAGADATEWAVPTRAVLWTDGLTSASVGPEQAGAVATSLGLAALLRRWTRDRLPLTVHLVDGGALTGTPDAAHADHLDLAEHDLDQPRRPGSVRRVVAVPFTAVGALRRR